MTDPIIADAKHIRAKDAVDIAALTLWRTRWHQHVALFLLPNGCVRTARHGTKTQDRYLAKYPSALVGVYSRAATLADIAADVRATERVL